MVCVHHSKMYLNQHLLHHMVMHKIGLVNFLKQTKITFYSCIQSLLKGKFRQVFNPIALRKAKIVCNFGLSECNRVKKLTLLILSWSVAIFSMNEPQRGFTQWYPLTSTKCFFKSWWLYSCWYYTKISSNQDLLTEF